jgi:endonuclease/exonuclease/phosphatase (EEP) superfamily protein YafD
MLRRILAAVVLVVLVAVLVVAGWPQLFGLERQPVIAQVVSLRGLAVLVAAALVILFTLFSLLSAVRRRLTGSVALVLLVFSAVTVAVLATRGFGNPAMQTTAPADVVVLSWNTLGDAPGAEAIARLALESEADVVVLPETSAETAEIAAAIMSADGRSMQPLHLSLDEVSKARTTAVLISVELGAYTVDTSAGSTPVLPSLIARPVDGSGPAIVAAHPVAPVPGEMGSWRAGLDWLATACQGGDVILAGDLNATLDHFAGLGSDGGELGSCHDAARATGNAAVGTWPTSFPPLLGAPIDHVMATDDWQIVGFRVVGSHDGDGSDHRPVIAQLRPAG